MPPRILAIRLIEYFLVTLIPTLDLPRLPGPHVCDTAPEYDIFCKYLFTFG